MAGATPNLARTSRSGTPHAALPRLRPICLQVPRQWKRKGIGHEPNTPAVPRTLADLLLLPRLGIDVARTISLNYSNQETSFTVGESVRDEDVFIIQSTATGDVNEGLMELLIMICACRTAR